MREIKGYITEKIFDCFAAGVVPIYWGASNIEEFVDKGCFIDRKKFANNNDLYYFIKNMKKEEYENYLENIRLYLISEKAQLFSFSYLVDCFVKGLKQ